MIKNIIDKYLITAFCRKIVELSMLYVGTLRYTIYKQSESYKVVFTHSKRIDHSKIITTHEFNISPHNIIFMNKDQLWDYSQLVCGIESEVNNE